MVGWERWREPRRGDRGACCACPLLLTRRWQSSPVNIPTEACFATPTAQRCPLGTVPITYPVQYRALQRISTPA